MKLTPRKALVRTVFQTVVGLAAGLPLIVDAAGVDQAAPGIGLALAVSAAVTRIMALPAVNELLRTAKLGWLAADEDPA